MHWEPKHKRNQSNNQKMLAKARQKRKIPNNKSQTRNPKWWIPHDESHHLFGLGYVVGGPRPMLVSTRRLLWIGGSRAMMPKTQQGWCFCCGHSHWTLQSWKDLLNLPPKYVEAVLAMVKGWREGDRCKWGSQLFARADMGSDIGGVEVPPFVGWGWEGMASSGGLGARGPLRQPGRQQGRLRWRAVRWSVMAADSWAGVAWRSCNNGWQSPPIGDNTAPT